MDIDQFEPATVLVVDDVELNRDLFRAFFENTRHRFLEAVNGREGVEVARRERPDLILMDVRMPVMDGVQATRILKADPEIDAHSHHHRHRLGDAQRGAGTQAHRRRIPAQAGQPHGTDQPVETLLEISGEDPSTGRNGSSAWMTSVARREGISPDAPERTAELLAALAPDGGKLGGPTLLEAPVISEVLEFGETLHALAVEYASPRLSAIRRNGS